MLQISARGIQPVCIHEFEHYVRSSFPSSIFSIAFSKAARGIYNETRAPAPTAARRAAIGTTPFGAAPVVVDDPDPPEAVPLVADCGRMMYPPTPVPFLHSP